MSTGSILRMCAWLRSLGVSAFIVASDQGFMRRAALQTLADFRSLS